MVTKTPKKLENLCLYKIWENSYLESKLFKLLRKKEQIFQYYYQHLIDLFVRYLESGYWKTSFELWFLRSCLEIMNEGKYNMKNLARVGAKARGVYQTKFILKIKNEIEKIRIAKKELLKPNQINRKKTHAPIFYKYELD